MATESEIEAALAAVQAAAEADPSQFPVWEDASDLARLHVQDFAQRVSGGFNLLHSRGSIRFAGSGVRGHAVDISQAGELLAYWQGLVTGVGGAVEGNLSARGSLPADVVERTRLDLVASPSPGSVVLEFEPHADEASERYPEGQTRIDGESTPLVERAVNEAMDVLALASSGLEVDLADAFANRGPRVAARARDLAELAGISNLDIDTTWEVPGQGRKRVRATASELRSFAERLRIGSIDGEPATLEGTLRTVSDRRKIDLEVDDPADTSKKRVLSVDRGDVDFAPFRVGEEVRLVAMLTVRRRPGGAESVAYTAERISSLTDDQHLPSE